MPAAKPGAMPPPAARGLRRIGSGSDSIGCIAGLCTASCRSASASNDATPAAAVRVHTGTAMAAQRQSLALRRQPVAKLGLLILFIGISFLLKYTAARVSVPIEFRLAGIVLADLALLAWGWRIRASRPAIALPVQGAALAVLMLVTFGAFRIYHLIPASLAFGLLLVLTVFTCLLAVLQDAMWLAIFGITGGFAAPILASTGSGSHIGLFTYYALLNAGVFAGPAALVAAPERAGLCVHLQHQHRVGRAALRARELPVGAAVPAVVLRLLRDPACLRAPAGGN
jgi:hypothetical protein